MGAAKLLIIRREQMEALGAPMREDFVRRALGHVQGLFPRKTARLGDERVRAMLGEAMDAATRLGICTEKNVALYADLWLALEGEPGRGEADRWIGEILQETARSEHIRMYLVYRDLDARCPDAGDDR